MNKTNQALEPEVMKPETAISRQLPAITINELATLEKGGGIEIIQARIQILNTVRRASIAMTSPEDWLLFKRPDGRITGYLQDSGAERVRPLWGIEIHPSSDPTRHNIEGGFMYVIRGDGVCHLTGKSCEAVEGGRGSDEKFCEGKKGALLELAVRKAARANLDGSIVRELAGMASIPAEELEEVWKGSNKRMSSCAQGRGFSKEERHSDKEAAEVGAPLCPTHKIPMLVKGGAKGKFWGCPKWSKDPDGCKKTLPYQEAKIMPADAEESPRESGDEPPAEPGVPSIGALKNDLLDKIKTLPVNVQAHFKVLISKAKTVDDCVMIQDSLVEYHNSPKNGGQA